MAKQKYWDGTKWVVIGTDADQVSISSTLFVAKNVEDALKELFTSADNGKKDIASVIGSPATSNDSFSQLKTHIQNNKNQLATSLTSKGQAAVNSESLQSLIAKVGAISTGKKVASGKVMANQTIVTHELFNGRTVDTRTITVNGLSFQPSVVIAKREPDELIIGLLPGITRIGISYFDYGSGAEGYKIKSDTIRQGGFTLPCSWRVNNGEYEWVAYE